MYKNLENGAKLPISTKYAVEKRQGATTLAARASRTRLRWVVQIRHGPIAATRAGLWSGETALVARAMRAGLWCNFDKRHRASAHGTTVASSRRAV